MTPEERHEVEDHTRYRILRQRGISYPDDTCSACQGLGARWYGGGQTWRGGMGPASITSDVCDRCWGSGNINRPWLDLRKSEAEEQERVERRAQELFAEECHSTWAVLAPVRALIREALAKLARKRKLDFSTSMALEGMCKRLIHLLEDQKP